MDLVVIGILSVALVLIVIRRCKKAKEEKKPIELWVSARWPLLCCSSFCAASVRKQQEEKIRWSVSLSN